MNDSRILFILIDDFKEKQNIFGPVGLIILGLLPETHIFFVWPQSCLQHSGDNDLANSYKITSHQHGQYSTNFEKDHPCVFTHMIIHTKTLVTDIGNIVHYWIDWTQKSLLTQNFRVRYMNVTILPLFIYALRGAKDFRISMHFVRS